jgi:hypothetical protein
MNKRTMQEVEQAPLPTCGLERAAAILHAHPSTVAELARNGAIRGRKVGRAWVFVEADLIAYIQQGRQVAPVRDDIRETIEAIKRRVDTESPGKRRHSRRLR